MLTCEAPPKDDWDRFVEGSLFAHPEQTSAWAEVKEVYGWNAVRIGVRKDEQWVGGAQVLVRRLGPFGNIGFVPHGPAVAELDPPVVEATLKAVDRFAREARLRYLVVAPPVPGPDCEQVLRALRFSAVPPGLPPSGLISASLILDLNRELSDIFAGLRPTTRYNIRRAMAAPFSFREAADGDIGAFVNLMHDLCRRRGVSPTPPQPDFVPRLWRAFHHRGWMRIFLVEHKKVPVAGLLAFTMGGWVRCWKVGWNGCLDKQYPNKLLWWKTIEWAKQNGYRHFDFVWIPEHSAKRLASGHKLDGESDGIARFKVGFGGTLVRSSGPRCRFYSPVLRVLMKCGGNQVLGLSGIRRFPNRLWGRIKG